MKKYFTKLIRKISYSNNYRRNFLIVWTVLTLIVFVGLILYSQSNLMLVDPVSLALKNRSINAYFGTLITAMALIITLTSNLYSPRLAQVFVTHPLTIFGVGYMVMTNLVMVITSIISTDHLWYPGLSFVSLILTIIAMLGIIPFLYKISQFIKPSYFVPLMRQYCLSYLDDLHNDNDKHNQHATSSLFDYIDVISNMASTSLKRSDTNSHSLVLNELFIILDTLIFHFNDKEVNQKWRRKNQHYGHGLSEEGKYQLKKNKTWPEAYILTKITDNMMLISEDENEILPYVCRKLTDINDHCITDKNQHHIRLNLMVLNTLLMSSLEKNSEQKFISILHYYRLNIELLIVDNETWNFAFNNFLHYGHLAFDFKHFQSTRSFLFDLGRLLNYISFDSEFSAIKLYQKHIKDVWCKIQQYDDHYKEVTLKSIIKIYWTLKSQNLDKLTRRIHDDFLTNDIEHKEVLSLLLENDNPMGREINNTMVNVELISGMARQNAQIFLEIEKEKEVIEQDVKNSEDKAS